MTGRNICEEDSFLKLTHTEPVLTKTAFYAFNSYKNYNRECVKNKFKQNYTPKTRLDNTKNIFSYGRRIKRYSTAFGD